MARIARRRFRRRERTLCDCQCVFRVQATRDSAIYKPQPFAIPHSRYSKPQAVQKTRRCPHPSYHHLMNTKAPESLSITLSKASITTSTLDPEASIFIMGSNSNNQGQQGGGKSSMAKSDSSRVQSSQMSDTHDGGACLMYANST